MNVPRIVIAGLYGEGGKTTVATGLMGTFTKKGLKVQPFKSGPDHIDATYHNQVTKKPSRHLDAWLTSPRTVLESFQRSADKNDLAIIEGAGGIFQGIPRQIDGISDFEGTAQIARILKAPIILVLDIGSMMKHRAEIAHAILHTFKVLSKQIKIDGIIINNVKGWQQTEWAKRIVKSTTKLPILGVIPYNPNIILPARRGGLVPIPEREELKHTLSDLVEHVQKNIETDKILEIAKQAEDLPEIENKIYPSKKIEKKIRVGITFDEAFSCHNKDNFDLLESFGAEIIFFSPIHDKELPKNLDALYFTSGFPERVAEHLSANQTIMKKIKDFANDEMPIYSEHGGSLYLTKSIKIFEGSKFPMVGIFSGKSEMDWKMQALDSTKMKTINDNILTRKGTILHGNDFRFSRIIDLPKDSKFGYEMKIGKGIDGKHEGIMENNVMAVMGMIYFAYDKKIAKNFVGLSEEYQHK